MFYALSSRRRTSTNDNRTWLLVAKVFFCAQSYYIVHHALNNHACDSSIVNVHSLSTISVSNHISSKCMIPEHEAQAKFNEYKKHNDHMMKYLLMAPKWTRERGQQRSSSAISRTVRQPAAKCPKDCQTTVQSSQLGPQPSVWCWTITNTWAQSIMT